MFRNLVIADVKKYNKFVYQYYENVIVFPSLLCRVSLKEEYDSA